MEEAEVKVTVKKSEKKRLFIIIGIVAALAIIIGAVFLSNGTERKLQEYLDLGQKYIDELGYEQALASYLSAIEIDPMCAEAYIGAADAYIGMGDYENAEAVLEQGYEVTADAEIEEKLAEVRAEIERIAKEEEERKKAEEEAAKKQEAYRQIDSILLEVAKLCSEENYDGVFTYMQSEDYSGLADGMNELGEEGENYIAETEYGSLGVYKLVYRTTDQYVIYCGDYNNGMREGTGAWLGGFKEFNYYYLAHGEWSNDVPQGHQEIREKNEDIYNAWEGDVVNGLYNGTFYYDERGEVKIPVNYDNGKLVVLEDETGDGQGMRIGYYESSTINEGGIINSVITFNGPVEELNLLRGILGYAEKTYL